MIQTHQSVNEPVKTYEPGSKERQDLQLKYDEMANQSIEIPLLINGEEIKTGDIGTCIMPHDHKNVIARYHKAGEIEVKNAIQSSLEAWKTWSKTPLEERTEIFRTAARLLQGPWRDTINAATMLNQSKNVYQAEIDSACELIDFFNFNSEYA